MTPRGQPSERLRVAGLRSSLAGPFDLSVESGECIAISGASGSGKSLFLRMIADLDPSDGQAWLDGRERSAFSAPDWRRHVVYNPAEPGWWSEHVADHFSSAAAGFASDAAPRLGLAAALLDTQVARLSTGERQRIGLLRALALDSSVLLLDEPTGALDADSTAQVEAVLRERLIAGVAIVMVTHNPAQSQRIGSRRFVMQDGRLVPA